MNSKADKVAVRAGQKVILLVDDDPSIREVLGRVLAAEGYLVLPAADGLEALTVATDNRVDLVLLDLNMPGQAGWDTFEKLTSDNPLLGVIIITARSNQLFTSLGAGVGALVEKPFDYPALLDTVRVVLAEPAETRLARMAGRPRDFHYLASGRKLDHN